MQNKAIRNQIELPGSSSPEDLRRSFEAAVCEIYQADGGANPRLLSRLPIVPRRRNRAGTQDGDKKRALSNAAQALAQLWKI